MNSSSSNNGYPPNGGGMGPPPPGGGGGGGMGPPPDFGSSVITPLQRHVALYGYSILFIFGFFGHATTITIFLRRTLRSVSTSCLFVCMTISDIVYLITCFYQYIFLGLGVPTTNTSLMNLLCRIYTYIQYFSMCCTAWLLLTITIDRWLRIRFPFRVKQLCTRRRVLIGACVIVNCSTLLNFHLAFPSTGVVPGSTACAIGSSASATYQYFYSNIWPILLTSLQIILPTIFLLTLSINIFIRLRRQQQQQQRLKQGRRAFLDRQMLIIMLTSIFLFFITQIPLSLFNILMIYVLRPRLSLQQQLEFNTISIFLASINYSASFYIHCLSSRLFRTEFFNIIHFRRNQRIGIITQMLGLEGSLTQTQIQLFQLPPTKSMKT
ncbi:unnamed protein product [Adineta steineri]|uniref:G-protein coupled receptors family 1 profile domain-containing protein n=1 Tax=Adineta steineri TaxID=433720 RepID=A0A818SJ26_9BILA|nr:unnamed protein product [Adineta steineri]CAF1387266.1 unnamed protein product [Adineta steineri]CAF3672019.1 unnamed protein product [Adineta steineri]CAF3893803.1 unnamed protein product [Adineta steineri]